MPEKDRRGEYQLKIPLDASGIKDFKPDRGVKVVAFDAKGRAYEHVAKLDAEGKGVASLSFEELGTVHVVVGPENASAEQMKGLQTISVDVSRRQWGDKRELTVAAIPISAYYWWWWFWWCRNFKITGRVLCENGNPVPGAQVCAYDVDWWWWWWSKEQVGCATTDVNGAFEIDFTWCCGWWPWWWWWSRTWLLEPMLAEQISRLLREAKFTKIPTPGPQPDPGVFQQLLGEPGVPVRAPDRSSLVASSLQAAAASQLGATSRIDPSSLESVRARLVAKIPAAPEFERLRLWPWWPWWPWWDCDLDIIFKVTQNCHGQDRVIVDETIWNARLDIPTNMNVTLVANEQACCITQGSTCFDGGDCGFFSDICEDNIGSIGGNPGPKLMAPQIGYLNPGLVDNSGDRPYSGTIPLRGCIGNTVDYYEMLYNTTGFKKTFSPLPTAAALGFDRSYWDNGLKKWIDVPFPVTSISDGVTSHNVIESLPHYETNNGAKLWDAFTVGLIMELVTQNVLVDGTYYLRLRGWKRPGYAGNLADPIDLPVCGSEDLTGVVVTIDNHLVTAGPVDLDLHPCGAGTVHQCTTEPDTEVVSVKILHNDGTTTDVGACGNVAINDTDMVQIDFVAYDPDPHPHLGFYTLTLDYDVNLRTNLLDPSLAGWSLVPSPIPPAWALAAAQVGPNYGDVNPTLSALSQPGAASPNWAGGAMRLTAKAKAAFPYTCCYQLQLYAHKRTIGGGGASCDHSFWNHWNVTEYSFTITV
jgi:hypothetical protein